MAYLQKEGGTHSRKLSDLASKILLLCQRNSITLIPTYIPGVANLAADVASRRKDEDEWLLDPAVFRKIQRKWGGLEVDLFASPRSHQL